MVLSRWTDDSGRTMEQILENIMNYEEWHQSEVDPFDSNFLGFNISKDFGENKEIEINGETFYYNYLTYEYEKIRAGEEDNELRSIRVSTVSGYIVIYTDGVKTQYITNRSGNQHTKTILRKLNNYTGRLELKQHAFRINEDLFTWMIYKVLEVGEHSLDENVYLLLKQIVGFKGATHDELATVTGAGDRIMNLLSTLAFLFENESVTFIKPIVEYENDTIEFSMDLRGTIDIDFNSYTGEFMWDHLPERDAKIILKTSLEVLPLIIENYHLDKENEVWSDTIRRDFFTSIGGKIQEKIDEIINPPEA